jgi:ATP synthase protein I
MAGRKEKHEIGEYFILVTQLGLTMGGSILFCFLIGRWLDNLLNAHGIILVIFILFGIVGGAITVYRQIEKLPKDKGNWGPRN